MKAKLKIDQQEMIMDLGRRFTPVLFPDDLKKFPIGQCFDSSAIQALYSKRKYRYVEGICKPMNEENWVLHAWLTTGDDAIDSTWVTINNDTGKEIPFAGEYIGIEMDIIAVAEFMKETGYQGVIANRWRNEELATKALESCL